MDSLHVLVGVLLQLGAASLLRRGLSDWRPWLLVLSLELLNEANDLWVERWPDPGQQYGEGVKDILLTMILPTLLLIIARRRPALLSSPPR
ncbi:hypothetical protein M8312_04080 [Sphingomonas sp. KRR8]|uniref:hypothetical protein n=1 Tax=Sphingomonas sp. KRR8 TaxID=2942996 RepID=UPI0020207943|nr:hypothetical protein [Sphingomonas sp. KRR8]URD61698.1 hypothetical protein M8312_04080 [Sphingomonas sp. KRR8]